MKLKFYVLNLFSTQKLNMLLAALTMTVLLVNASPASAARAPYDPADTAACISKAGTKAPANRESFCVACCNASGGYHACIKACHETFGKKITAQEQQQFEKEYRQYLEQIVPVVE